MLKKLLLLIIPIIMINQTTSAMEYSEDLCYDYEQVITEPMLIGGCVDFGPFTGGINCKKTIPVRNISGEEITRTQLILDFNGVSMQDLIADCGINNHQGGCDYYLAAFDGDDPLGFITTGVRWKDTAVPTFTAVGGDSKHSIYVYNLMKFGMDPFTMFGGENLYARYTKDGTPYHNKLPRCQRKNEKVEDLCYSYDGIVYDGPMCVDFGPFQGGMGCKQTIPISSLTDQNLSGVSIMLDQHGMNGNFVDSCGIDGVKGECANKSFTNFGPVGMMARGYLFEPMPDFEYMPGTDSPYARHSIYTKAMMEMSGDPVAFFRGENMYTHYTFAEGTSEAKNVEGYIPACPKSREPVPDLCYEMPIDYSPVNYKMKKGSIKLGACYQFGPFKGGMGCKETVVIRSITNKMLVSMEIFMDTHGMNGRFLGGCGINDSNILKKENCQVKERLNFGPMGFFSSGVYYEPMPVYDPFDVNEIFTVAGWEMGVDARSFILGENLYTRYTSYSADGNSTLISGRILSCKENFADDLCIEDIYKSIAYKYGFIPVGIKNTATIKNQRGSTVTKVSAVMTNKSILSGDCELDSRGSNNHCNTDATIDIIVGIGGRGTIFYETPYLNFDPYGTGTYKHKLKQNVGWISGVVFDIESVYANFVRGEEFFSTELSSCITNFSTLLAMMHLDAWDGYRAGLGYDRQISTKIVNEPFTLTIASMNSAEDKYQPQDVSTKIYYDIYEKGSTTPVSGVTGGGYFDASKITRFENDFTVPDGYKDLRVGFKICSINPTGTKYGNQLQADVDSLSKCEGKVNIMPCEGKSDSARWHVCKSTDNFAVRPKNILISTPSSINPNTLRAGKTYTFGVKATYWDASGSPRAVPNYTKTLGQGDLNKTLILKTNVPDTEGILAGDLNLTTDVSFVNGEGTANIFFTDVARVLIRLEDKEWAKVDTNDTPESCEGGIKEGVSVPDGRYLCGALNTTFIPDHFALKSVRLVNHNDGSYTYLGIDPGGDNDDINMSAHVDMSVVAENFLNQPTQNFRDGFYENPVSVTLTVPQLDVNGIIMNAYTHDLDPAINIGFGLNDASGTYHFAWNYTDDTIRKLNFNYPKNPAAPIQPFRLAIANPLFDINVTSDYAGVKISGSIRDASSDTVDSNATFHYVKVAATQKHYDDISTTSKRTPIRVLVYCPTTLSYTQCGALNIDTTSGSTNDSSWWLSTEHDQTRGYGNIALVSSPTGTVTPNANITSGGIDNNIFVTNTSGTVPQTVNADPGPGTSTWLIDDDDDHDSHFTGTSDWAGKGPTGYVVDSNASSKKNKRLGW